MWDQVVATSLMPRTDAVFFYENPVWVLSQVHQQPDTYCQSIRNKKEQNG